MRHSFDHANPFNYMTPHMEAIRQASLRMVQERLEQGQKKCFVLTKIRPFDDGGDILATNGLDHRFGHQHSPTNTRALLLISHSLGLIYESGYSLETTI